MFKRDLRLASGQIASNVVEFAQPVHQADARTELTPSEFLRAVESFISPQDGKPVSFAQGITFEADGLHFRRIDFPDSISLTSRRLDFALHFEECEFRGPFEARWAELDALSIRRCVLHKPVVCSSLKLRGTFDFSHSESKSQIDLAVAELQGDLVLYRAKLFYQPDRPRDQIPDVRFGSALFCAGIGLHSILMDEAYCEGRIFLDAARLTGILKAAGATLIRYKRGAKPGVERFDHIVLSATDTDIEGAVILGEEAMTRVPDTATFHADGQISLCNSRIGGDLICTNGKFHSAFYRHDPHFLEPFVFGDPHADHVTLCAIDLARTKIEGGVLLDRGFQARGPVIFDGVTVAGDFRASEADINAALPLCEHPGEVGEQRQWIVNALSLQSARILGNLFLTHGFRAVGSVIGRNATIAGDVNCQGATIRGCWSKKHKQFEQQPETLSLSGASIGGSVFLVGSKDQSPATTFISIGQVRLRGTRIERNLHLGGGNFRRAKVPADAYSPRVEQERILWFHSAKVGGTTFFNENDRPPIVLSGSASFAGMETSGWEDCIECWPQCREGCQEPRAVIELDGLVYKWLRGPMRGEERLIWLLHQPEKDLAKQEVKNPGGGFKTQPWEQCAKVLYELGYRRDSRLINRGLQRFLRVKGGNRLTSRAWYAALDIFVGSGYRVFYTVLWALALVMVGAVVATYAMRAGYMTPAKTVVILDDRYRSARDAAHLALTTPGEVLALERRQSDSRDAPPLHDLSREYPPLNPFWYSLDDLLPAPGLHQTEYWTSLDGPYGYTFRAPPPSTDPDVTSGRDKALAYALIALLIMWGMLSPERVPNFSEWSFFLFGFCSKRGWQWRRRYKEIINKGRRLWRYATYTLIWLSSSVTFLAIADYWFDWQDEWYYLSSINVWLTKHSGMSLPHLWFLFESLMGWILISVIVVGLTSAVFRRGD